MFDIQFWQIEHEIAQRAITKEEATYYGQVSFWTLKRK